MTIFLLCYLLGAIRSGICAHPLTKEVGLKHPRPPPKMCTTKQRGPVCGNRWETKANLSHVWCCGAVVLW